MLNPEYNPETAHMPNARDKELWRLGGREKHRAEKERQARVVAKWESVQVLRAAIQKTNFLLEQ